MEFTTPIKITKPGYFLTHTDPTLLIGSCFAENIGDKLIKNKFRTVVNPFGILYNPASISHALNRLSDPRPFEPVDLFQNEGVFHSFDHHSRFSGTDPKETIEKINRTLVAASLFLKQANRLILTFGTSYAYRLKETGRVVSNCHKLPDSLFTRDRLEVADIVKEWQPLLRKLIAGNPDLKILFTVSPIRHRKDGAHANQLSKATLLLAIDKLYMLFPEQVSYFPAYEIMMDELRDYRFYADDMFHPSSQAIEYIWERFSETLFSPETNSILKTWEGIQKAVNHRPFQPGSDSYRKFIMQTLLKAEQIKEKFPSFDIEKEIEELKIKIK